MPPESFHWDRKDLSNGRKRERPVDPPLVPVSRMGDYLPHGTNLPPDFNCWSNNGGYHSRASGQCEQGGLHHYPQQPSHGLYPLPSSDGTASSCRQNDWMTSLYHPSQTMTSPSGPNDRMTHLYRPSDRISTPGCPTDSRYLSTPQCFNGYANTPHGSIGLQRSNDYWVGGTQYPYVNRVDTRTYFGRAPAPHHSYAVAPCRPFGRGTTTPHSSSERGTPSFLPSKTVASPSRSSEKSAFPFCSSELGIIPLISRENTTTPHSSSERGTPSFLPSKTVASPSRSSEKSAFPFRSSELGIIPLISKENIASPYCSSEKIVDDETGQSSESAVDGRCNRDSSGSTQKDLETNPLENGEVTDGSGKPLNVSAQRLVEDMPIDNSLTLSDSGNAKDELHSKDQNDKIDSVNALGKEQRLGREGSLGSIDWKSHGWTRRSSSFLHLSGSKSFGADSSEGKAEAQDKIVNQVETQSGDPSGCVQSALVSEEIKSRKKPRVRWGEGLAKYEKKKADVFDDSATKNGGVDSCSVETSCSDLPNLADKTPTFNSFPGFVSPTTTSSVGCSSSPGIGKQFPDTSITDNATSRNSGSQDLLPIDIVGAKDFDLESLDAMSLANLSSSLGKLLQFNNQTSEDSSVVRATSLNKLRVWKGSITKALEMTESEIDSLENELKSLAPDTGISGPCQVTSSSLLGNADLETSEWQVVGPDSISQVSGLQIVSSVNPIVKDQENDMEEVPDPLGGESVDGPDDVTSKLLGPFSLFIEGLLNRVKYNGRSVDLEAIRTLTLEPEAPFSSSGSANDMNVHGDGGAKLYDLIISSNKECAARASDFLKKLMPHNHCGVAMLRNSSVSDWSRIKEQFVAPKQLLKFKDRVYRMKFMVFRRLCREDTRLLSVRKNRATSRKTLRGSHQRQRSSIRTRFSPGGNSIVVPSAEIINFTKKLLSGSQFKRQRKDFRMPAMVLDKKEKVALQFVSNNGLVQDPCAVEKERALINPWTTEEKKIFMDKLLTLGKDFRKIASFLDHKTTADCVEFYYKNHKSDCFRKAKKKLKLAGQRESSTAHKYLVVSEKRLNREAGAASLDLLGAVSAVAANLGDGMKNPKNCESIYLLAETSNYRAPQLDDDGTERLDDVDALDSDRDTIAVGVLAEAVSDGSCSDDSCDEMYSAYWTDEEKLLFVQALKAHGKDFAMISRCMKTKSESLCAAFFTKTRGPLGLDNICSSSGEDKVPVSDGAGCGGSDCERACGLLNGSVICSEKLDDDLVSAHKMDVEINNCSEVEKDAVSWSIAEELLKAIPDVNKDEDVVEINLDTLEPNSGDTINVVRGRNRSEDNSRSGEIELEIAELEQDHVMADVSIGDCNMELNPVGICKTGSAGSCPLLVPPPHNSSEDGDTGLGYAVEQPVAGEISADHNNLTVSGTEGETIASSKEDSTACLVTGNSSACEDVDIGSNVFASLPGDRPNQDMNLSREASNVAIVANTLVKHPEKKQLAGLELHPSSGSLSSSFGVGLHPPSSHCERVLEQGVRSTPGFGKSNFEKRKSVVAVSPGVDSCQFPAAQFIPVAATRNETSGNICSKNPALVQTLGEVDGNARAGLSSLQGSFFQKRNSLEALSSASQIPYLSLAKRSDHANPTSDLGRPCKSGSGGVFKLFGKILTTSIPEPSDCNGVGENNRSGNQLNTGWRSGGLNMRSSPVPPEGERLGLENASLRRSYGFCDGNRAQTNRITSLPDSSSLLLAKNHPSAFSKFSPSFPNTQQPLQLVTRGNGQQYFGSSSVADHPRYRNWENAGNRVQPSNVGIGERQNRVFPEVPRRNNASSSQQQGEIATAPSSHRGKIGVLSGKPLTGNVVQTVAAIRLGDVAAAMERIEAQKRSTEQGGRRWG